MSANPEARVVVKPVYRRDLDGLRALAVLPVVLYHAGIPALSGGFVGVDVFFVLSGYLITQIIHAEMQTGRFTVSGFYLRRARRILPALFVVLGTSLVAGVLLLTPNELKPFGISVAAALVSVSNFVFWTQAGYFEQAGELKPMLMTWSLGVEEQFYLFYPWLLLAALRLRLPARHLILVGSLASFAVAGWGVYHKPDATFYLLPTRAWELGLGAWLALSPRWNGPRALDHAAGLLGVALVGYAVLSFDSYTPFPGLHAAIPCAGTALLIAAQRGAVNTALLSLRPLVFVGLISYSLYLWHWPLLSFARLVYGSGLSLDVTLPLVGLAMLLATLSLHYLETPLRKSRAPAGSSLRRYGIGVAAGAVAALSVLLEQGMAFRLDERGRQLLAASPTAHVPPEVSIVQWHTAVLDPLPLNCLEIPWEPPQKLSDACINGAGKYSRTALLWGDSHSAHYHPGIAQYLAAQGYATRLVGLGACTPAVALLDLAGNPWERRCTERSREVLQRIRDDPALDPIIIASRWGMHERTLASQDVDLGAALREVVAMLVAQGHSVVLLGQVPEFPFVPIDCQLRSHLPLGLSGPCHANARYLAKVQGTARGGVIAAARDQPGRVCVFDPRRSLCRQDATGREECPYALPGGDTGYWDHDHLTRAASVYLAGHFDFAQCLERP